VNLGYVRPVIFVSAFILSGAPSIVMQLGAWALMIGQRGEQESIVEVVKVAFLGAERCQRCQVVEEGVGKEQNQQLDFREFSDLRLVNMGGGRVTLPSWDPRRPVLVLSLECDLMDGRIEGPPTPPPRLFPLT
jgi:hypothetical protein